jgi:hypothetical protein
MSRCFLPLSHRPDGVGISLIVKTGLNGLLVRLEQRADDSCL